MQRSLHRLAETYPVLERLSLTNVLAEVVTVLFVFLMFTALYRGAPNTRVRFASALLAGLIAGIAFVLLQNSFLLLQKKVFSYNRLYGGFAALPLFLVWMNWSWQIVLFGAEVSFVSQNIDSGIFEAGREKERSLRLCREHQLAIVSMVFRNFTSGCGALDEKQLFASLRLPESMLRQELSELLDKKILCRTLNDAQEMAFLPGVPPERFTVLDFLRAVHGRGDEDTPVFAVFERTFCNIEQEIAGTRLNIPIIEIENNTVKES